ncbi:glycine betaine/L-proline ABC transporter, ATP-binding protein, partial [mine drainage metagenome]
QELRVSTNLTEVYRLMRMTVRETIILYSEIKNSDDKEAFDHIESFELEDTLDKMLYELSTGQQKLIGNILAFSFSPQLILLDEPFENVDQMRRIKVANNIIASSSEILLNTHEFDILGKLNGWSLYFMIEGKLFGKFDANKVKNLYINRGVVQNNLSIIETSYGKFSITENEGEVSISGARNFNS